MSESNKILFTNKNDMDLRPLPYHSRMQQINIINNPSKQHLYKSYYEVSLSSNQGVILTTRVEREQDIQINFRQVELKRGQYIKECIYVESVKDEEKDKIPNNK